jgi:uncharacterized sporulation protein YeaH/YhbH (DUF444 family)
MNVVDRRLNPKGKSLANRQRFLRRAREQVRKAVSDAVQDRKVSDVAGGVSVTGKGLSEPSFGHGDKGVRDYVLPGNKTYSPGDEIARPDGGSGSGKGSKASDQGGGEDEFVFTLTRDEFLQFFFEDLELPDMIRQSIGQTESSKPQRAGFSVAGSPSALNVQRTMRNSLARRMALSRPGKDLIRRAEQEVLLLEEEHGTDTPLALEARRRLEALVRKAKAVPFIDPVDVRYNRFERVPKPITKAVMFCLMDVSGSMSEHKKDLAKRFFMLLHLFLDSRYEKVDIVFIRHTEKAQVVDEETFFRDRETGGTIVSTALEEMVSVMQAKYPTDEWNVYAAQASDGDNFGSDSQKCVGLLQTRILPHVRYFAYIEVQESDVSSWRSETGTDLWKGYETVSQSSRNFAMRRVKAASEIYGVLHDLFSRERAASVGNGAQA